MGNNHFAFKQFEINQSQCAMKVCTDACLFGSWIAAYFSADNALDIGTGTGLLSLLYAQQHTLTQIDAIEIDNNAATQAADNIAQSPWPHNIHIHSVAVQQYAATKQYDLIFSNPPFFENDLKSSDTLRNTAHHSTALTLEELYVVADQHTSATGTFCVLLPHNRLEEAILIARKYGWHLQKELHVRQSPRHHLFRAILAFGKTTIANFATEEISIKDETDNYTEAFSRYLEPYYRFL